MSQNSSRGINRYVISAACIALSTVIANFASFHLPFGGSITVFSMLFVTLPGYLFGPVVGISAAVAHGILQFISNPYIVHPLQVIFDYFLAFGALGLSGFFNKGKHGLIKGYSIGVLGRFIFSSISGMIFFTEYMGVPGKDFIAVMSGILYNLSYIGPEYVITIVLLTVPAVKNAITRMRE